MSSQSSSAGDARSAVGAESFDDKLARVLPMVSCATAQGLEGAASDAWDHKGRSFGTFGVSAGVGALVSSLQAEAGLPKVVLELGLLAVGVSSAYQFVRDGKQAFSAIGDAWNSPQNLPADAKVVADTFGPLVFNAGLSTIGSALGAKAMRTIPVALKEKSLLNDLERFHPDSAAHSIRVGEYSRLAATEMRLPSAIRDEVYHTGLMHDIGKLHSPLALLDRPTNFTEAEWGLIHQHPGASFDILQDVPYKGNLRNVPINTLAHHEWLNGTGYPNALVGEQIPFATRVMTPADVFDAVTEGRKYSDANRAFAERMPLGKVKKLIDGAVGTHYDAAAVDGLWNIRADKAIGVLESGPGRNPVPRTVLSQFKGSTLGRLLDVMNEAGAAATDAERDLAVKLNEIYNLPTKS
jgi:HD-GYP domain-containing protein (c-di-GMP phosphodiesterase class II)